MPRIRSIKPEIHLNEKVGQLSHLAFRLFIGMITLADDEGRLRASTETLRANVLPYQRSLRTPELEAALAELQTSGLARWYGEMKQYAVLLGWAEHQRISHPAKSRLPEPSGILQNPPEDSRILQNIPQRSDLMDRRGSEGSIAHREASGDNGTDPVPEEWRTVQAHLLTLKYLNRPELFDWDFWRCIDEGYPDFPDISIVAELSKAEAWCLANPRKVATRKDWKQFVRNWFDQAAERLAKREKGQRAH